jgi:hypothetical protein
MRKNPKNFPAPYGRAVRIGPYVVKCSYQRRPMLPSEIEVGMRVRINDPGNSRLHGQPGVVERLEPWGAHLQMPAAASGRYRAVFEEMDPDIKGELSVSVEYTGNCCDTCGSTRMRQTGTCMTCQECGTTSGCV